MQIVERERHLGGEELRDRIWEALRLAQQTEQLAAADKVHDHVEVVRVFERAPAALARSAAARRTRG